MTSLVHGQLLTAGGEPAVGVAVISWAPFSVYGVSITGGMMTVDIIDGELSADLYPNAAATPNGSYYTVQFELQTGSVYEEYWIVPDGSSATLEQVRVAFPTAPGMAVSPQQITGMGSQAGMVLTWNGAMWVPGFVSVTNIEPNYIRFEVGNAGVDFWIDGSPASLGSIATFNLPDASPTARGVVTTGPQSFAGNKTFTGNVVVNGDLSGPTVTSLDARLDVLEAAPKGGVVSFNTRTGAVVPAAGDYTVAQVTGAVPQTRLVSAGAGMSGGGALSADVVLTANVVSVFGRTGNVVLTPGDISTVQTPWLSDINAANFSLSAVASVGVVWPGVGTVGWLQSGGGSELLLNAVSGKILRCEGSPLTLSGVTYVKVQTGAVAVERMRITAEGDVGIGTATVPLSPVGAGRRYVSIIGSTSMGVLEVGTNAADADGAAIGQLAYSDATSSHAIDKRLAVITAVRSGVTPTNRGGALLFGVHADGDATVGALERVRITGAGNVGIGTAAPAYKLDVGGDVNITGVYRVNGVPITTGGGGGSQTPWTSNIDAAGFALNNVGKVGVGTMPVETLDVLGTMRVKSAIAGWSIIDVESAGGAMLRLLPDGGVGAATPAKKAWYVGVPSFDTANALEIFTYNGSAVATYMAILNDGKVGIGTVAPSNRLTVVDPLSDPHPNDASTPPASWRHGLMVQGPGASYDGATIQMGPVGALGWAIKQKCYNGAEGALGFYGFRVATGNMHEMLTLNGGTGRVGIGEQTPLAALHVRGASLDPSLTADNAAVYFAFSSSVGLGFSSYPGSDYGIWIQTKRWSGAGPADSLAINPLGGNVGIHKRSPTYPLDVSGDINITGVYRVNGVPISSGGQAQTPWLQHINANGFQLNAVSAISCTGQINCVGLVSIGARSNLQAGGEQYVLGLAFSNAQAATDTYFIGATANGGTGGNGNFVVSDSTGAGVLQVTRAGNLIINSINGSTMQGDSVAPTSRQIITATGNGYVYAQYFNSVHATPAGVYDRVYVGSADGYIRWVSTATFNSVVAPTWANVTGKPAWNSGVNNGIAIARCLEWNYQNLHGGGMVVFDASGSVSPSGTAVDPVNAGTLWGPGYPTLMGWNGNASFGVRVESSKRTEALGALEAREDGLYFNGDIGETPGPVGSGKLYRLGDTLKIS